MFLRTAANHVPLQIGKRTPRDTCNPRWEPLV